MVSLLDLVPKGLYQKLDKVDLNKRIEEEDNFFDAVMCVGTFTFGQNGSAGAGWEWAKPGDVYHGPFVDDQMHGIGQWTHAKDGMTERIQSRDNTLVGWPDRT